MSQTIKKILVTGATGFIGKHFLNVLKDKNHIDQIRILVRKTSDKNKINDLKQIIPNLDIFEGDLKDINSLTQAVKGFESIVNLAAIVTYKNVPDLYNVNINGVKNLCEVALKENVKKFVHISSIAALGYATNLHQPLDENSKFKLINKGYYYAESKYKADIIVLDYFKKYNLPAVICLPSEVYGEYGWETARNLVDLIKFPIYWDGGTSVVYVNDVAEGIYNAITKGKNGEKYILGGENLTIKEITEEILNIANIKQKPIKIPNFIISHPIKYISHIQEKLNIQPLFDPHVIKYATKYWFVNSKKARKELKFQHIDPSTMFSKTINWLKKEELI